VEQTIPNTLYHSVLGVSKTELGVGDNYFHEKWILVDMTLFIVNNKQFKPSKLWKN